MTGSGDGRPTHYRFGVFEVDVRAGELRKQGLKIRVRGRPLDILIALLERPGDVVTRDELRTRLWPADTFVDFDHGLNSAINRLREGLGDSADNPRFIETLPRRGYKFIAPVTASPAAEVVSPPQAPDPAPHPVRPSAPAEVAAGRAAALASTPSIDPAHAPGDGGRRRLVSWLLVAATVLVAVAALSWGLWGRASSRRMTIAVLPFDNLSGDPEQEYFSDGFTEEMIAALGMLNPDRLGVIGRTTSMLYKHSDKTIGQIGEELGVSYLLEGSVRRAGGRLRITAQLVETRGMTRLWSDTYERDVTDVLAVQADVARQIARSLTMALDAPGTAGRDADGAPASFPAYELYMRGRFFREQATEEGARRAIDYYEQALAVDANYAAAHAALADAYRLLGAPGWEVEPPRVLLPRAKIAAERALALDRSSPEARAVLAMIRLNFDWDLAGAEQEIQEALRLNPSFSQAHQYYSGILTPMQRADEAIAAARRAVELDPLSATASTTLGVRFYYARRCGEAVTQYLKTLEVTPGFAVAHWGLAQCYREQRQTAEAIDQLKIAVQLSGNSAYMRAHLAYGYARNGQAAEARALATEIARSGAYVAPYHLALIAAGLGDADGAVQWLERAFDDRSGWMVFLPVEPAFDAMRQAPAFQRLLARVSLARLASDPRADHFASAPR